MSFSQELRGKIIANSYKQWNISDTKVLDVGCGNGVVTDVLKNDLGIDVHGPDIVDYRKVSIPFMKMNDEDRLPCADGSFEYVMFNDMLHHTQHIEALLQEGRRAGQKILIFEDVKTWFLRIFDPFVNSFHLHGMKLAINFKNVQEWCRLFDLLGFQYEIGKGSYPFWYPFRHMVFKLQPKKSR